MTTIRKKVENPSKVSQSSAFRLKYPSYYWDLLDYHAFKECLLPYQGFEYKRKVQLVKDMKPRYTTTECNEIR